MCVKYFIIKRIFAFQAVKAGGGWGKTLKERPPTELILEAQNYVKARIEKRWLPLFLASKEYQVIRSNWRCKISNCAKITFFVCNFFLRYCLS